PGEPRVLRRDWRRVRAVAAGPAQARKAAGQSRIGGGETPVRPRTRGALCEVSRETRLPRQMCEVSRAMRPPFLVLAPVAHPPAGIRGRRPVSRARPGDEGLIQLSS